MTYIRPSTKPTFSGHNTSAQNESAFNYDLEFNTSRNITITSLTSVQLPDKSFAWADCRSVNDSADTDVRHSFNLRFNSASLSERVGSLEASGRAGIYNVNLSGDITYMTNKSGAAVSSTIRCTSLYNDFDQNANFNRFVGFRFA